MSDTTAETETTERKPPTIAEIVREKTDDGARIIDFFLDVMEGRVEGAELCHRMDAAKELVKFGSAKAVIFIAKYKGIPCGHSTRRRRDSADSCIADERSLVEVTLNAPANLTREFLTVLSGIDEFLMTRLIRAQTADGGTIIDFLDDVMQDRNEGFKTYHRLAAARELIVHILRDEQPSQTPSPSTEEGREPALSLSKGEGDSPTPSPLTGEGWGEGDSIVVPAQAEGNPDNTSVVPAKAGTQGDGVARPGKAGAHPEPNSTVVPAEAGTQGGGEGRRSDPTAVPAKEPAEGRHDYKARRPRKRLTRTQRRREGNARAAARRKALGSERKEEEKDEKPAPAELTIAERRIKEKLEQHWHEPDPWAAPIDSASPGRSPPW